MTEIQTGNATGPTPNQTNSPDSQQTYTVERGDNFWTIAQDHLRQTLGREPTTQEVQAYWLQLMEANADRLEHPGNFDLIYPDQEFVLPEYVPPATDGGGSDDVGGAPEGSDGSQTPEQARAETDEAFDTLERLENSDWGTDLEGERQESIQHARNNAFDAVQNEVEVELDAWLAENPDATPEQIEAKANEIRYGIESRREMPSGFNSDALDFRTQQAINNVSARHNGYNLEGVAPGTDIQDGPYTEDNGPFVPDSTIEDVEGRTYRIDGNGHIANGPVAVGEDDDGNVVYEVYENGVSNGQTWSAPEEPSRPSAEAEPPENNPVSYVPDDPSPGRQQTDAAASNYYDAAVDGSADASQAREAFIAAIRAELATGGSLEDIQARYGDDPFFNEAIHEAAYGS